MSTADYVVAYRDVAAGLKILREHAKRAGLPVTVSDLIYHAESRIVDETPPWKPEPAPEDERPWSEVMPGDSVKAPNGTWYAVDSVARIGQRMSVLLVAGGGGKVQSKPAASDKVPVRRGDVSKAVDIFRAGGLDLTMMERAA